VNDVCGSEKSYSMSMGMAGGGGGGLCISKMSCGLDSTGSGGVVQGPGECRSFAGAVQGPSDQQRGEGRPGSW
jgi:hypothetical protein